MYSLLQRYVYHVSLAYHRARQREDLGPFALPSGIIGLCYEFRTSECHWEDVNNNKIDGESYINDNCHESYICLFPVPSIWDLGKCVALYVYV